MKEVVVLLCLLCLVSPENGMTIPSELTHPDTQSVEKTVEITIPPSTVTEPELPVGPALDMSSSDSQTSSIDTTTPPLETSALDKSSSDSQSSSTDTTSPPLEATALDKSSSDSQSSSIDTTSPLLEATALDKSSSDGQSSSTDTTSPLPEASALDKSSPDSQSSSIDTTSPLLEATALDKSSSDGQSSSTDTTSPLPEASELEKSSSDDNSGSPSQPDFKLEGSSTETKGTSSQKSMPGTTAPLSDSLAAAADVPTMDGDKAIAGPYPKSGVSYQTTPQVFVLPSSENPTHLQKKCDASSIETSGVPSAALIFTRDFSRAPELTPVYGGAGSIMPPHPLASYLQTDPNLRNGQHIYIPLGSGTTFPSENGLLPSYTHRGPPVGSDLLRYPTQSVPAASYQLHQTAPTSSISSTQGLPHNWYQGASYTFPYGEVRGENSLDDFSSGYIPHFYSQQYYFKR